MLSEEQKQQLLTTFDSSMGCPTTAQDRLAAFSHGAVAMLKLLAPHVTLDGEIAEKLKKATEKKPETKAVKKRK